MKRSAAFAVLALLTCLGWGQDSLWSPSSTGFYTGRTPLKEGDLLRVILDTEASLSFTSSKNSDKLVTFEFTKAPQGGNPLEFLPGLKSGDTLKLQSKNELKAKNTSLMVQVVKIRDNGLAEIEGQRSLTFPSGTDGIHLKGVVDPRDVKDRRLVLDQVGELQLTFFTAAERTTQVFKPQDWTADGKGLTPEKQKELLLKYYNRFLDVLFPGQ